MPHLPQPVRARGFTAHRATRRVAKAVLAEKPAVVKRKRARKLLAVGAGDPATPASLLTSPSSSAET